MPEPRNDFYASFFVGLIWSTHGTYIDLDVGVMDVKSRLKVGCLVKCHFQ